MAKKVRTRFAPSPTGFLHVGGLRTALYNYLYAKQNDGDFILRIEDTDRERFVEGAVENLIDTLKWVGLEYDEGPDKEGSHGPYIQSQRLELYKEYAQKLIDSGHAYYCFCTPERLEEMRKEQMDAKKAPMYDRKCLKLSDEEIREKLKNNTPYVIRLKMPDKIIQFEDVIRHRVSFNANDIDDSILMKSDGYPTYHLANVVDDYLTEITHVIRGEEWLPSTPKHIILYESFGWEPPTFAHLPLLLNKDRTKLSKRQNDVAVEDYIKNGYLKEAINNFIAFLGWNPGGEQEIYSLEEMVQGFKLDKVHKAGAIFDIDKFDWFNWQWKRRLFLEDLSTEAKKLDPEVDIVKEKKGHLSFNFKDQKNNTTFLAYKSDKLFDLCQNSIPDEWQSDKGYLHKCLLTLEEKILKEPENIKQYLKFYFTDPDYKKDLVLNEKMKVDEDVAKKALENSKKALEQLQNFDDQKAITQTLLKVVEDLGLKNGQVLWPLRAVLTGEQFSPGVFEVAWALGKEESMKRIEKGILAF